MASELVMARQLTVESFVAMLRKQQESKSAISIATLKRDISHVIVILDENRKSANDPKELEVLVGQINVLRMALKYWDEGSIDLQLLVKVLTTPHEITMREQQPPAVIYFQQLADYFRQFDIKKRECKISYDHLIPDLQLQLRVLQACLLEELEIAAKQNAPFEKKRLLTSVEVALGICKEILTTKKGVTLVLSPLAASLQAFVTNATKSQSDSKSNNYLEYTETPLNLTVSLSQG